MEHEKYIATFPDKILEAIQENEVYQQVLADSMGGIMYNVANYGKYESGDLLELWDSLSEPQKSSTGGIRRVAISFLHGN